MFKLLLPFAFVSFLYGCATPVEEKIKYTERYILPEVPQVYLQHTKATAPVEKNEYMKMSQSEKERALSALVISLHGDIATCNADKDSIFKVIEDQRKRYGR